MKFLKALSIFLIISFIAIGCGSSSGGGGGGGGGGGEGEGPETKVDPLILSLTTDMGDNSLSNILMPKQKSVIWVSSLKDENVTVEIEVDETIIPVTPQDVSTEDNILSFIAPDHLSAGYLRLKGADFVTSDTAFEVMNSKEPYLLSIDPVIATSGQMITIKGGNLPEESAEVVFQGKTDEIIKQVTPAGDTFSIAVPIEAVSGLVYMRFNQYETNKLALTVKRGIKVKVTLEEGVSFEPSQIGFILGLNETTLDTNFEASLNVEKYGLQYLNAIVSHSDDTASLLYIAAVLPDMQTVTIDARSTAIAMVLMALGTLEVSQPDNWRSVYDAVALNGKVGAFADYIAMLQKDNFSAWKNLDDTLLMQKFKEALEDVISSDSINVHAESLSKQDINTQSASSNIGSSNMIIIKQDPDNDKIYVNDTEYFAGDVPTFNYLNNGSVNIINDSRLFLSFEARSKEDNKIIGKYSHAKSGFDFAPTIVEPKGKTSFSNLKNVQLKGIDANLQFVIGSKLGPIEPGRKAKVAEQLLLRAYIKGMFLPITNIVLGELLGQSLDNEFGKSNDSMSKRFIGAWSKIYAQGDFIADLSIMIQNENYRDMPKQFITEPLLQVLQDCQQYRFAPNTKCWSLVEALAILYGLDLDKAKEELVKKLDAAIEKHIIKKIITTVTGIEFVIKIYKASDVILSIVALGETIQDTNYIPKQINVDVDFPLEITDVAPMCIGVTPTTNLVTLSLEGKGFPENDDDPQRAKIGDFELTGEVMSTEFFTNEAGTEMTVMFDGQELITKGHGGSKIDHLYLAIGDHFNWQYDKPITIVDQNDKWVDFHSINPSVASPGQTVTLKGCGWIPLNDLTVWFESKDGFVKAHIRNRSVDSIDVTVPKDAVSGAVFVTSGIKDTRERNITITRECSKYESLDDLMCKQNCISGSFFGQYVTGDFAIKIQHNGSIVGVFESVENAPDRIKGSISGRVIGNQIKMGFSGKTWEDIELNGSLDGSGSSLNTSGQVHRTDQPAGSGSWSAKVVSQNSLCDEIDSNLPKPDYVVWYMDNVRCWDAPRVYATDRAGFESEKETCNVPGGGRNCEIMVKKVPLKEGFNTLEEAQSWFCPQITTEWFHYWCNNRGPRVEIGGGSLYTLQIPCDLSDVPYKYP